jgi:hypothetical protein
MRVIARTELTSPILQPGNLKSGVERIVAQTATDYEREVKEQMRAPKHGRTYRRSRITRAASSSLPNGLRTRTTEKGNRRAIVGYKLHRASAPGEAPAVDKGLLINSIQAKPDGLIARVFVGEPYGAILEYRRDRPVFEPTLERMRPGFIAAINEEVSGQCQ